MKSGKFFLGMRRIMRKSAICMTSVCLYAMGVIFAGNNAQAYTPPSGYSPNFVIPAGTPYSQLQYCVGNLSGGYSNFVTCNTAPTGYITQYSSTLPLGSRFYSFALSNLGGQSYISENDIIAVQFVAETSAIELSYSDYGAIAGYTGVPSSSTIAPLLSVEVTDFGDSSLYTMLFQSLQNYNGRFYVTVFVPNVATVTPQGLTVWRRNSETNYSSDLQNLSSYLVNIQNELKECNGNTICETQYLKKWVYDIGVSLSSLLNVVSSLSADISDISDNLANLETDLGDLVNNSDEELETNKTEKENIENQNESDIADSTDQKTESLMSAFGQFLGVFTSATPSNCNVHVDLGNHFGVATDFGNLNLCSLSVPVFVPIIGSIFLVVTVFGLTYHLLTRIFSLIREMRE